MKLILFDVDGTLTESRKTIQQQMIDCLVKLKKQTDIDIGFVGGSDLNKQIEQLKEENFHLFDWRFSENGLLAYKNETLIHKGSFVNTLGEIHFKKLVNICLSAMSITECPIKRGTFLEYRTGMINICPVGRQCTQEEREEFYIYDIKNKTREQMIHIIENKWNDYISQETGTVIPIKFSIGGQISVDVFPEGWDKTFCLQFVENKYDEIHFFGDKTMKGGNDYEIYNDHRVIGHHVSKYQDTIDILNTPPFTR
jgi:phosphomannomutase